MLSEKLTWKDTTRKERKRGFENKAVSRETNSLDNCVKDDTYRKAERRVNKTQYLYMIDLLQTIAKNNEHFHGWYQLDHFLLQRKLLIAFTIRIERFFIVDKFMIYFVDADIESLFYHHGINIWSLKNYLAFRYVYTKRWHK